MYVIKMEINNVDFVLWRYWMIIIIFFDDFKSKLDYGKQYCEENNDNLCHVMNTLVIE